jgi:hypothetical protein
MTRGRSSDLEPSLLRLATGFLPANSRSDTTSHPLAALMLARFNQNRTSDAGVHRAARRRRKTGLRAKRRQALVRQALRPARTAAARISRRRSLRLQAHRRDGEGQWRRLHLHSQENSHTAYDFIKGAEAFHHTEKVRKGKATETFRYRWFEAVPLRDGKDAMLVNWIGFEIIDAGGSAIRGVPGDIRPSPDESCAGNQGDHQAARSAVSERLRRPSRQSAAIGAAPNDVTSRDTVRIACPTVRAVTVPRAGRYRFMCFCNPKNERGGG